MKKIFKYSSGTHTSFKIEMPYKAIIRSVQMQGNKLCFWAEIDEDHLHPFEQRSFSLFGTGWDLNVEDTAVYLATIQEDGFVWHVYEHV